MNEQDDILQFLIPVNYNETTNVFLGLINPVRLLQGALVAAPFLFMGIVIPFVLVIKILLIIIAVFLFIFGLVGWKDLGIFTFFKIFSNFLKQPKNFSLTRIKRKEEDYATSRNRKRSRQPLNEKKSKKTKKR